MSLQGGSAAEGAQPGSWRCSSRTPFLIAATYVGVEAMGVLLSLGVVPNCVSTDDGATALQCIAFGGADGSLPAVKIFLVTGVDLNILHANGLRPYDVVASLPHALGVKLELQGLLGRLRISNLSPSSSKLSSGDGSSSSDSTSSPVAAKKEYPVDPSLQT